MAERDSFFPLKYDSISKGEEPLAYYHDGPKQRLIVVWVATRSAAILLDTGPTVQPRLSDGLISTVRRPEARPWPSMTRRPVMRGTFPGSFSVMERGQQTGQKRLKGDHVRMILSCPSVPDVLQSCWTELVRKEVF